MFPEKIADMTPEQKAEWDKLQEQARIRREYRAAGKLDEWEKKRHESPPLKKPKDPAPAEV